MDRPPERLRYRFGFLLQRQDEGRSWLDLLPGGWRCHPLDPFRLLTHPELPLARHRLGDWEAIALGNAWIEGGGSVAERLAGIDVDDEAALSGLMDDLCGRFALVFHREGRVCVLHDPIGSRAVFYHAGATFAVGSHPLLVASAVGAAPCPEVAAFMADPGYGERANKYLPGDRTPFRDVLALTPNCLIDSMDGAVHRYWPRGRNNPTSIETFDAALDRHLAALADHVSGRYHPVFGLTGGVDSRTAIAAFRRRGVAFETVTWRANALAAKERRIVVALARLLGVPHHALQTRSGEIGDMAAREAGGMRGPQRIAPAMLRAFADRSDLIFLRGWGGEVLRGYYHFKPGRIKGHTPEEMTRAYMVSPMSEESMAFAQRCFEQFHVRTESSRLVGLGYDPNDIFYWEHRLGTWAAAGNNELDPAMPSLIVFNGRRLFTTALGLSPRRRLTKRLLLDAVARYDAALAGVPLSDVPMSQRLIGILGPGSLLVAALRRARRLVKRTVARLPHAAALACALIGAPWAATEQGLGRIAFTASCGQCHSIGGDGIVEYMTLPTSNFRERIRALASDNARL